MPNRSVSIVIDNYNYARFLRQAIDSALAQAYRPLEVVVVDDGSTDESAEIMRSYGDKICAVFKENGGQASAFNAGFARSTGEIVALLDADDYLKPGAIEQLAAAWKDDTDILFHRVEVVDETGRAIDYFPTMNYELDSSGALTELLRAGGYACPPTSGMSFSRRLLGKILPMPHAPWQICADAYLAITTPFLGRVDVMTLIVACYRIHGSNLHGVAITNRRLLNARKLKRDIRNEVTRRLLLEKCAALHGKTGPHGRAGPVSHIYFNKLLLYRATSRFYKIRRGAALHGKMVRNFWIDRKNFQPGTHVQKPVVGVLILLAPRGVLRRIYPSMFPA